MVDLKIVVVDDDEDLRRLFLRLFTRLFHCTVVTFESAARALGYLGSLRRADLIISDVDMEGMGGLELLTRMRQTCPAKTFIVMSGDPSHERRAMELGASGFLQKPVEIQDFLHIARGCGIHPRPRIPLPRGPGNGEYRAGVERGT